MNLCGKLFMFLLVSFPVMISAQRNIYNWSQNTKYEVVYLDTLGFKIGDYMHIQGTMFTCCDGPCPHYRVYDSIAKFINANPQLIFQIESHTDCRASAEYNRDLSQRRADTAKAELLRLLNDSTQLPLAVGMGEDDLYIKKCQCDLSDYIRNCTEAEHQLNRRTLLRIIAIKDSSLLQHKKLKTPPNQI